MQDWLLRVACHVGKPCGRKSDGATGFASWPDGKQPRDTRGSISFRSCYQAAVTGRHASGAEGELYEPGRRTSIVAPERERLRLSRVRRLARVAVSRQARAGKRGGEARSRSRATELSRDGSGCDRATQGGLR